MFTDPRQPGDISLTPRAPRNDLGGPEWGRLVGALTRVMDLTAGSNPPDDVVSAAAAALERAADLLTGYSVGEDDAPAGKRSDVLRRGHPYLFATVVDDFQSESLTGRITFGRVHLGRGAVHGGVLAQFFDEHVGMLVASGSRRLFRTAALHVDYRHLVPIDHELRFTVAIKQHTGRKLLITSQLLDGDRVMTDAELLMIEKAAD